MITSANPTETVLPECVDLRQRFGKRFRVAHEQSYHAEHGDHGRVEDTWLLILLCQHGEICPWGGELLAACTKTRGPVANRLLSLPFVAESQDGDDGANVIFPVERFDEVATIMRPRRRRQVSEQERARLAALSARHGFKRGQQTISQSAGAGPESHEAPRQVSDVAQAALATDNVLGPLRQRRDDERQQQRDHVTWT